MENKDLLQSELTVVGSEITFEGILTVSNEMHLYGKIIGEIRCNPGSLLVLKTGSLVEGKIIGDQIIVDGFVKGHIEASGRIWITSAGKLVGSLKTTSLQIDPGAVFEAKVEM
ncbi:MAG: polymer-forming cytoskeletal protein [Bdellovibrionales bacterium]|nr:polymer-forming cytoskeletal protein [Bdellovibrionales bacterium]